MEHGKYRPDGDGRRHATFWEKAQGLVWLYPKVGRVSVLGTLGIGKTTLWESIQGRIPVEAAPTGMRREKAKTVIANVDDSETLVRINPDVGGGQEAQDAHWRKHFLRSEVVVYLINLPLFMRCSSTRDFLQSKASKESEQHRDSFFYHFTDMAHWQNQRKKRFLRSKPIPKMIIVGSWCDEHPGWRRGGGEESIYREFGSCAEYERIRHRLVQERIQPHLLVGSLETESYRNDLISKLLTLLGK